MVIQWWGIVALYLSVPTNTGINTDSQILRIDLTGHSTRAASRPMLCSAPGHSQLVPLVVGQPTHGNLAMNPEF